MYQLGNTSLNAFTQREPRLRLIYLKNNLMRPRGTCFKNLNKICYDLNFGIDGTRTRNFRRDRAVL